MIVVINIAALFFALACSRPSSPPQEKFQAPFSIYGDDDRFESLESSSEELNLGFTVGLITSLDHLEEYDQDHFKLLGTPFKEMKIFQSARFKDYPLCPDVRYTNRLSFGICSGFQLDSIHFITSAHCVETFLELYSDLHRLRLIFDVNDENLRKENFLIIKKEQVFSVARSKILEHTPGKKDMALLKMRHHLKRKMPYAFKNRKLSEYKYSLKEEFHKINDSLLLVGHPLGQVKKWTRNSFLRGRDFFFYYADLDAFGGNSGSPVINLDRRDSSGRPYILGILTGGKEDFRLNAEKKCIEEAVYGVNSPRLLEIVNPL